MSIFLSLTKSLIAMNNTNKIERVISFFTRLQEITSEIGQLQEDLHEVKTSIDPSGDTDGSSARVRELEEAFLDVDDIVNQLILNGQSIADAMDKFIDPETILHSPDYKDAREMVDKSPRTAMYQYEELKERLKISNYRAPTP